MKLILKNHQSPGDIMMLTSLVRDIKKAYPHFRLRVRTSADQLFYNNPNIEHVKTTPRAFNTGAEVESDRFDTTDKGWLKVDVHYGDEPQFGKDIDNPYSIHKCGSHKKHFMYGMIGYMNQLLDLDIKLTELKPDIYLSSLEETVFYVNRYSNTLCVGDLSNPFYALDQFLRERQGLPLSPGIGQIPEEVKNTKAETDYWVVCPGGKPDYPRKIWAQRNWEELFDLLPDVNFVQIGGKEKDHIKPIFAPRSNVLDLTGQTTLRDTLSLVANATGVITPISFPMHAAAAFPGKLCIVIAGGGEHHTWEAYPGHYFLHTCGVLPCCRDGGCWEGECKNRAPDGEQECMKLITAEAVAKLVKKQD